MARLGTGPWQRREAIILALLVAFSLFNLFFLWQGLGRADFEIFLDSAIYYRDFGRLYPGTEADYAPGSSAYKFPPLFASGLVILLEAGVSREDMFSVVASLQVALYLVSVICLTTIILAGQSLVYRLSVILASFAFIPFYEVLVCLQLELYVLFLLSLALWCCVRGADFRGGICIGFATALKIYPILLGWRFMLRRSGRGLAGILCGLGLGVLIGICVIGPADHFDYLFRILPQLLLEKPTPSPNLSAAGFFFLFVDDAVLTLLLAKMLFAAIVLYLLWKEWGLSRALSMPSPSKSYRIEDFMIDMLLLFVWLPNVWASYQLLLLPTLMLYFSFLKREWQAPVLLALCFGLLLLSGDVLLRYGILLMLLPGYEACMIALRFMLCLALLFWLIRKRYAPDQGSVVPQVRSCV